MAFTNNTWARVSTGTYDVAPVIFAYQTHDSLSTVTASGYFNDAPEVGNNDIIIVTAGSVAQMLQTTLTGTTFTTTVVNQVPPSNSIDSEHYVDGSIDTVHLADNSITAVKQASGTYPLYSKLYTTTGGGTSETITFSGLLTTDIVLVHRHTKGATPVTCQESKISAADTISLTFSADPSTDHKFNIAVFRPLN